MKTALLIITMVLLSGCAEISTKISDINATYSTTKQNYINAKSTANDAHLGIGAEIEKEKEFWKAEHKAIKEAL